MSQVHSPAMILQKHLIALGWGVNPPGATWPIFIGTAPTSPDNIATLYDTTGRKDGRSQRTGRRFTHPGFQLRLRAKDYPTGWAKAQDFCERCDATRRVNITIAGKTYRINAVEITTDGPLSLGQEENSPRVLFAVNGLLSLVEILA